MSYCFLSVGTVGAVRCVRTIDSVKVFVEANVSFVYKIPYRRARAWPSGCSAFRPSARASKGILHTNVSCNDAYSISCAIPCAIVEVVCEYYESLRVVIAKYKISVSVRVPSFMS